VINPAKSLEDDQKFGKALVEGFIEPYKKSWSEGKYFEVAGRAAFDVGSLFIGAGEANAAIKGGAAASKTAEVANVAGKTAEVANVASKTAEVANVASKTGKATEVANVAAKTGKTAEVANATSKVEKASEVASITEKASEMTSTSSRMTTAEQAVGKTDKVTKAETIQAKLPAKAGEETLTAGKAQKTVQPSEISSASKKSALKESAKKGAGKAKGPTSKADIIDNLKGKTKQGDLVADGIHSGDIGVNVLGDELFDRAYAMKGGTGEAPQAFQVGDHTYVRRESPTLSSDLIHEGTHRLDELHGNVKVPYEINPYTWEKRAFFYERQFQLASGGNVEFRSLQEMSNFIYRAY
jgi:hypothetical protein